MSAVAHTARHMRIEDAHAPLWLGSLPTGWGDVVHRVLPAQGQRAADVVVACGLDWQVRQCPLEAITSGDAGDTIRQPVPRHLANVRSDTGAVLGVVGDGYRPLQNCDALALADDLVDSGAAHWVGAGSTRGGARIHAVMRLDREIRIGGAEGEDVLPLLLLRNGHDGGMAVTVGVAPFRLACLNGMLLPVTGAARTWRARHTASIGARLNGARRTLGIAWSYYDELEDLGARLLAQPLHAPAFDRFLARLVPLPPAEGDAGGRRRRNVERVREEIRTVWLTTPDLDPIRTTAWGAVQAVAAYCDHHARSRTTTGRTRSEASFERATAPAALKDRALAILDADS